MDYSQIMQEWINKAKDYPTKALLTIAYKEYLKQAEYLKIFQNKLDGQAWSRKD